MMAAPPQYLDGLPSMFKDSKADPFRSTMGSGFRRHAQPSPAMSIPGSHDQHDVPPPLPPPRFLPSFHKDPNPFGAGFSPRDERPDYMRRVKPDPDEGYASLSTASTRSSQGLPSLSEFGLSHMQFSSSIDDYDKDIKRKLDPIKTFSTASPANRSLLSASMQEPSTRRYAPETRLAPLSVPSALPFHTRHNPTFESPNRYTETPLSAISPRSTPFSITSDYPSRSPYDTPDLDRSPRYRSRRANSGSVPDDMTVSTQGSYGEDDMEIDSAEPTSSISRLRIIDDYHSLPQKRRALSPPGEDQPPTTLHGMPSHGDLFRQRNIASRGSPTPRLSMQPAASIASTMSTTSRSGSNFSVASSMTSYGRRSPNGLSPGGLSPVATDVSCSSPYMTPTSNPSPRASLARGPLQRSMQTFHMCDCCPKKPRKFETEEELRAHEAEKQYECSFCGNRFKNKNEAERHQNSLHVRRHSWSCSALYAYDKAFHESTNRPGEADTCGYCGDEFPRSGRGAGGGRVATEEDWVERNRHLQEVHKFRECNSSKKFYRADHFRQHLKHSHQGTPGKWTNMLENACMMEEEPPMPR